jgi:hypothetical protein
VRPLVPAGSPYTEAEILAQLSAQHALYGCRFDVLGPDLSVIGALEPSDTEGVYDASVADDVDRAVKRTLSMGMFPTTVLGTPYSSRVKPWFQLQMPDGGLVEWPQGVFVWDGQPGISRAEVGDVRWSVEIGDQGDILDLSGPGTAGFTVPAGTRVSDAIVSVVSILGMPTLGVTATTATVNETLSWGLRDADGNIVSWRMVLQALHSAGSLYSPWFDGDGYYQATPVPDVVTAPREWSFSPGVDSTIIPPADSTNELQRLANFIVAISVTNGTVLGTGSADLNDVSPGHEMSQGVIGFYIRDVIEVEGVTDPTALTAAAAAELRNRFSRYEKLTLKTLAVPHMESFSLVGVQWPDDETLSAEVSFHSGGWGLNLFTGEMENSLRRVG